MSGTILSALLAPFANILRPKTLSSSRHSCSLFFLFPPPFLVSFSFLIPAAAFWFLVPRNTYPIFSDPRPLLITETRHCPVRDPTPRPSPAHLSSPRRRRPLVSPPSAVSIWPTSNALVRSRIPRAGFKTTEASTSPTDARMQDDLALSPATGRRGPARLKRNNAELSSPCPIIPAAWTES